jgi:magnesium-transporting ATPase (P-type)
MAWHPGGFEHARWLAFTALVVAQAVRAYANRSLTLPLQDLPPNRFLAMASVLVIATQALIPVVPGLSAAFHATPLDALDWTLVLIIALAPALLAWAVRARRRGIVWVA